MRRPGPDPDAVLPHTDSTRTVVPAQAGTHVSRMQEGHPTPADAAILDINLSSTLSYPLADRLAANAVPFVFLTGFDGWALPEAYRSAPRLSKPCLMDNVVVTVGQLMTGAEAC